MRLYVLYTSYPYEGGFIHGVFSSREKAKQARKSTEMDFGEYDTYIGVVELDKFAFQQINV